MRLLVSVSSADEARAALEGGADLIDAKDPASGPLGAVSIDTLREIVAAVGVACPVTAAIGDASSEAEVEALAHDFAAAGVRLVKIGLAGVADAARARALVAAAVRGARSAAPGSPTADPAGVVVVAYADALDGPSPEDVLGIATETAATGVLIDTRTKTGPGLLRLMTVEALARWTAEARARGLVPMLAGRLTADDVGALARGVGAEIAGVRGAACEGGRTGRTSAQRVRVLRTAITHGRC